MKIIIAGAGEVGTYLAKMLYKGNHDITVIDNNQDKLSYINNYFDFLTVNGSATSIQTLKDANIKNADLYIAITEIEEVNITAAILGKSLGAKKTIARINNMEYLEHENRHYLTKLGIDSLIYPEILASNELINVLRQNFVVKTFEFSGGALALYLIKIDEGSSISHKTLLEAAVENEPFQYRTVAIYREGKTIIPGGKDVFLPGDTAYIVTSQAGINKIMNYAGKEEVHIRNIMILGGSRIGRKTAKALEDECNIKLLEKDKVKSFELADYLDNTLVISSDGRDVDIMLEEGIQNMDAFVAVTGNSETNILSCLLAKKMGVKKTVAEIENMDYMELAENMGIDIIINKKLVAASHIFSFTMDSDVAAVQCLNETDAEILEFQVSDKARIIKDELRNINFPKGALIAGVIRGKSSFIANGETQIRKKDRVIVFSLPETIDKVAKLFH